MPKKGQNISIEKTPEELAWESGKWVVAQCDKSFSFFNETFDPGDVVAASLLEGDLVCLNQIYEIPLKDFDAHFVIIGVSEDFDNEPQDDLSESINSVDPPSCPVDRASILGEVVIRP